MIDRRTRCRACGLPITYILYTIDGLHEYCYVKLRMNQRQERDQ